jgi:hypothetical protein
MHVNRKVRMGSGMGFATDALGRAGGLMVLLGAYLYLLLCGYSMSGRGQKCA